MDSDTATAILAEVQVLQECLHDVVLPDPVFARVWVALLTIVQLSAEDPVPVHVVDAAKDAADNPLQHYRWTEFPLTVSYPVEVEAEPEP